MHAHRAAPEDLVSRLRTGDREAVGEFIARFGDRIRFRVRDKIAAGVRRVCDSQDLVSTVARRLDDLVLHRRLRARNDAQLWELIMSLAAEALDEQREQVDGGPATAIPPAPPPPSPPRPEVHPTDMRRLAAALDEETDRTILTMRVQGAPHDAIGRAVDMRPEAVRMRWSRIRKRLRRAFGEEGIV